MVCLGAQAEGIARNASRVCTLCEGLHQQLLTQVRKKDAKLAQKLNQLRPYVTVFPQEFTGQCAFVGPT